MKFYLGTHYPAWLAAPRFAKVPLFVSARRLRTKRHWPRAATPWALDSGGFTELQKYGRWETPAMQYSTEARRWRDEVGTMEWAAIQDWMCEDIVIKGGVTKSGAKFKGTGLSVKEHQRQTIASWHLLRQLAPDIPWVPVLQGKYPDDYLAHAEAYRASGTDLAALPRVGVGSVCRRQGMAETMHILMPLAALGLKLHGFGFKVTGLEMGASALLSSADSMAWSRGGAVATPVGRVRTRLREGQAEGQAIELRELPGVRPAVVRRGGGVGEGRGEGVDAAVVLLTQTSF